jgi:transcriptional regulator with XRE-family HTH domain
MEETFGQKLRALRRAAGITQRELAKRVGVDFSYISKLENDRLPPPAADTVVKICEVLDVAPDELLAATGKIPPRVQQSIGSSPAAIRFLRSAQAMELSEAEWKQLSEQLKRLRE